MRVKTIAILSCPNSRSSDWTIFATKIERKNKFLFNLDNESLQEEDDIIEGILVNQSNQTAFPIHQSIAVLLSDKDADYSHLQKLFEQLSVAYPEGIKKIIQSTINRIGNMVKNKEANWNMEEMKYYDEAVNTPEKRLALLNDIRQNPIWRIFLPRQKDITFFLDKEIKTKTLLEIGCGNARTISWILNPGKYNYNYIGADISFNRLLVASQNIPRGDFIQCSAFNLPFKKQTMDAVISFGVLHHLPNPVDSLEQCSKLLKVGGYIGFHEPIEKPKLFSGVLSPLGKITTNYKHSEHDGEINWDDMKNSFPKLGIKIIHFRFYNSIFRSFVEWLLYKISMRIFGKKIIVQFIFETDKLILQTICKIYKSLGPHAVTVLLRKENDAK